MKPYGILVPSSVVTKMTAAGYLKRIAKMLLENPTIASCAALDTIEAKIVDAGFLTWEQAEEIEAEAFK
ncbi:MAG: hypothetical protein LIO87_02595 [Eubacterium sp.]|nr:hypothetical protein [Eubacterium sp.]